MKIKLDDLSGPEIAELLGEHMQDMKRVSPPESRHALDLEGLRVPEIIFWTVWDGDKLAGCGALKELTPEHAEIKSMRTAARYKGKGIGAMVVQHLIKEAKQRRYQRLSLETGSMPFFEPARRLYRKYGFTPCEPFATYKKDPNSVYMTMKL